MTGWRGVFFAVILSIAATSVFATSQTLYINRGSFTTIKKTTFPAVALNSTPIFNARNVVLSVSTGEELDIKVINNDSVVHGFSVSGFPSQSLTIKAGDSASLHLSFEKEGIYLYYDNVQFPSFVCLGMAGMITVSSSYRHSFFWNIKEYQSSLNKSIALGGSFSKQSYDPDFFTINGSSYPEIQSDTTARVWGSVGDTVRIYLANTGQSMHSIHFHGFHATCLFTTSSDKRIGWSKDTWAIRSMEAVLLEFIIDKPGRYSVHDHNLVAVTAAKTHPNGMFTIMEFK